MISPQGLTLMEWADFVTPSLMTQFNVIPGKLMNLDQWHDWASNIINSPGVAQYDPPIPTEFSDWREWAFRFVQTVPLY